MRKNSPSCSRSASTIRKYKGNILLIKENNIFSSDSEHSYTSKSIMVNRRHYTLEGKKNYIKNKRGIYSIASELNLFYSSLREWIKQEFLITEVKCK